MLANIMIDHEQERFQLHIHCMSVCTHAHTHTHARTHTHQACTVTLHSCQVGIRRYWLDTKVLQRLDDVSAHHGCASKRPLVHDTDVDWRGVQLLLGQVLWWEGGRKV